MKGSQIVMNIKILGDQKKFNFEKIRYNFHERIIDSDEYKKTSLVNVVKYYKNNLEVIT